jgi:hypothetical protein
LLRVILWAGNKHYVLETKIVFLIFHFFFVFHLSSYMRF